jgi:hypothetical protein
MGEGLLARHEQSLLWRIRTWPTSYQPVISFPVNTASKLPIKNERYCIFQHSSMFSSRMPSKSTLCNQIQQCLAILDHVRFQLMHSSPTVAMSVEAVRAFSVVELCEWLKNQLDDGDGEVAQSVIRQQRIKGKNLLNFRYDMWTSYPCNLPGGIAIKLDQISLQVLGHGSIFLASSEESAPVTDDVQFVLC